MAASYHELILSLLVLSCSVFKSLTHFLKTQEIFISTINASYIKQDPIQFTVSGTLPLFSQLKAADSRKYLPVAGSSLRKGGSGSSLREGGKGQALW